MLSEPLAVRSCDPALEDFYRLELQVLEQIPWLGSRVGEMISGHTGAGAWYRDFAEVKACIQILDWYLLGEGCRTPGLATAAADPLLLLCMWLGFLQRVVTFTVPTTVRVLEALNANGVLPRH